MKGHPIIFSAPMIRSLLAGKKTQTRRVVRGLSKRFPLTNLASIDPHLYSGRFDDPVSWGWPYAEDGEHMSLAYWPEATGYSPDDVLWVREAWQFARQEFCSCPQGSEPAPCDDWSEGIGCRSARNGVVFRADGCSAPRWRSPIHMPRWASRLTLVVSEVRVQRVQNISEADAIAEGAPDYSVIDAAHAEAQSRLQWVQRNFAALWDAINGKKPGRAWADDPWVAAITFDVRHDNIDVCLRRDAALTALAESDAEEIANG